MSTYNFKSNIWFICLNRCVIMNHNTFYIMYWLLKCCEPNAQTVLEWGTKDGTRVAELISQNVSCEFIFMVAWCSIKHVYVPVDNWQISNGIWQSIAQSILIADCGKRHYMGCNMAVYIAPNMRLASKFCNKMTLLVLEVWATNLSSVSLVSVV